MLARSIVLPALLGILGVLTLAGSTPAEEEVVAKEIQGLVPQATAMSRKDFEQLASVPRMASVSDLESKSLTLMLFSSKVRGDQQAKEEFRFLTEGTPKPSELAKEMYRTVGMGRLRVLTAPVTMIQADRITDVTCEVDGDTAEGTISFVVPKLYQGRVKYVARRTEGKWRIDEFLMPAYEIHVVRTKNGAWEEAAQKAADENK